MRTVVITHASPLDTAQIPEYVVLNLAQAAYRAILRDWKDPAVREDFIRWKAEKEKKAEAGSGA